MSVRLTSTGLAAAVRAAVPADTAAWMDRNEGRLRPLFDAFVARLRSGRVGVGGVGGVDEELPPEAEDLDVDPFAGVRDGRMSEIGRRAAQIVRARYLAHLPPGLQRVAASLHWVSLIRAVLMADGIEDYGLGFDRTTAAAVRDELGIDTPANLLGGRPPDVRTEDAATDWLRGVLDSMGLADVGVRITTERPRFGNEWSANAYLSGRRTSEHRLRGRAHASDTGKAKALAALLSSSMLWEIVGEELLAAAGWSPPNLRDIPSSKAARAVWEQRAARDRAKADATSAALERLAAVREQLLQRFVTEANALRAALHTYPQDFETLRNIKAAIAPLGARYRATSFDRSYGSGRSYLVTSPTGFRFRADHLRHVRDMAGASPWTSETARSLFEDPNQAPSADWYGIPRMSSKGWHSVDDIDATVERGRSRLSS